MRAEDSGLTREPIVWVASAGGPLVVVPAELVRHWRGVETIGPLSEDMDEFWEAVRSGSDYGRACGVDDYLGVLEVGPGECLVLGDEPMQTTILPTDDGGLIVRWMYAESEQGVLRAIRSVPEGIWEGTPHRFHVGEGGVLLFDSAYPGDDLTSPCSNGAKVPWLEAPLPKGTHEVDTADYEPDDSTRIILHRLRRR